MDVAAIQRALAARGYDPGAIDGDMGPKTKAAVRGFQIAHGLARKDGIVDGPTEDAILKPEPGPVITKPAPLVTVALLRAVAPQAKATIIEPLAPILAELFPAYGITTPLRIAHFLTQAAHETDGFATLQEYASGAAYEGRKNLGNTQPGDGKRFKGRGIFQCTGRANYLTYGKRLGIDLVASPLRAADPDVSARIALEYWKDRGLNAKADVDDVLGITKAINGGTNGLDDRKARLARAKAALTGAMRAAA